MFRLLAAVFLMGVTGVSASDEPGLVPTVVVPASAPIPLSLHQGYCSPTSAPLVVSATEIFQAFHCQSDFLWGAFGISSHRCTMWFYSGEWTLKYAGLIHTADTCFPDPAILVQHGAPLSGRTAVVAQTTVTNTDTKAVETFVMGFNSSLPSSNASDNEPKPVWAHNTYGNRAGIAFQGFFLRVFFGRGVHPDPENPTQMVTSLDCVHGLTGDSLWKNGTRFTDDAVLSKPVFYESYVYWLSWSPKTTRSFRLFRVPADTGVFSSMPSFVKDSPCGINGNGDQNGGGLSVALEIVTFGYDVNGALTALMLYGNVPTAKHSDTHFTLCRVHHGGFAFGSIEHLIVEEPGSNKTVYPPGAGLVGGDNATVILFREDAEIRVYNLSSAYGPPDRLVTSISRERADILNAPTFLYQTPPILLRTQHQAPLMVFSSSGYLTALNTWTGKEQWEREVFCRLTGTAALDSSAMFCAGRYLDDTTPGNEAAAVTYEGDLMWKASPGQGLDASFPPIVVNDAVVFYSGDYLIGASVFGTKVTSSPRTISSGSGSQTSQGNAPAPPPAKGTSPGIIVLCVFLVIFSVIVILGVGVYAYTKRGHTLRNPFQSRSRGSPPEGALEDQVSLSTRSMHDMEGGNQAAGNTLSAYGSTNQ